MALGELYISKGEAFNTAKEVLQVEHPMSCNVSMGCSNRCTYCYNRKYGDVSGKVRLPKIPPAELVKKQLDNGLKPEGVFLCFLTDPFIDENFNNSFRLIEFLSHRDIKVATLSKASLTGLLNDLPRFYFDKIRVGTTICSYADQFSKKFEPNAIPISDRAQILRDLKRAGYYVWVSLEPYPTPSIWSQDLTVVLDEINFVDFIIFGKWNYDDRADGEKAREFYKKIIPEFQDYCKSHGIRHAVKTDTLKFIES